MTASTSFPPPKDNFMKWFLRFRKIPAFALLFLVFNFFVWFLMIFLLDETPLPDIPVIETILGWCWMINLYVTIIWTVLTPIILTICCISGFILFAILIGRHAFPDLPAKLKAVIPFVCYLILIFLLFSFADSFLTEIVKM